MPTKPAQSEAANWRLWLWGLVLAVTSARLAALAMNRTDIFVDEAQYWLWGQSLDFGYYSKPPLIAWVIRAATELAGSDAPFWLRVPGAVLHGATALILAALAGRLYDPRTAFWVGASYVTAPFTTVGSLLISTDTVMAPAYAAALYFYVRAAKDGRAGCAALAGAMAGLAFMAKYAAVYFLLGAGLAALFVPAMRLPWRSIAVMLLAFGAVIAPNIWWNLVHDLTTVSHTVDNVGWLRGGAGADGLLHISELGWFLANQFLVFGPILLVGLLAAAVGSDRGRGLIWFALPVLAIVCMQALLSRAYANWAVASYFAGVVVAVAYLLARAPWLLPISLAINGAMAVILPVLAALAPWPEVNGKPLLQRYLGRATLSHQIVAAAQDTGAVAVFAADREILADLFYTGRDAGLRFYAPAPAGRPHNYFEQNFALPARPEGRVLYVLVSAPVCSGIPLTPVARFDTTRGAFAKRKLAGYVLPDGCEHALD
jgi:4-amino-4-deoxy-L-arabinose transferase-like glycosyltransferase